MDVSTESRKRMIRGTKNEYQAEWGKVPRKKEEMFVVARRL